MQAQAQALAAAEEAELGLAVRHGYNF
eukprot:SAG31_NODE_17193_length_679_cov_1.639655_1_plen_26_part_10